MALRGSWPHVFHIKEGPEPFPARLQSLDPGEDGKMPGYDSGCTALRHLLGCVGILRVWNNPLPKGEILGPEIDGRLEAEIALREGNKGGKDEYGVSRKMMWL